MEQTLLRRWAIGAGNIHLLHTEFVITEPQEYQVKRDGISLTDFHITGAYADEQDSQYLGLYVTNNLSRTSSVENKDDNSDEKSIYDLDESDLERMIADGSAVLASEHDFEDEGSESDENSADATTNLSNLGSVGSNSEYIEYLDFDIIPIAEKLTFMMVMESGDHSPNSVYFSYADLKAFLKSALDLLNNPTARASVKYENGASPYK